MANSHWHYLQKQAQLTPNHIAITEAQHTHYSITYQQLCHDSLQVSYYCRHQLGIETGTPVALISHASIQFFRLYFGLVHAGALIIPIDDSYPQQRIDTITKKMNCQHRIQHDSIEVEQLTNDISHYQAHCLADTEPALVLFTSGTTGEPQGVVFNQTSMLSDFDTAMMEAKQREKTTTPAYCPFYTSISHATYFPNLNGLYQGHPTLCIDKATLLDPQKIQAILERYTIKLIYLTPSLCSVLLSSPSIHHQMPPIKLFGEKIPSALKETLSSQKNLTNFTDLYGATESAVWFAQRDSSGYFAPINGCQINILNQQQQPVAVGEIGELWAFNSGLALGYYQNPTLTQEKFSQLTKETRRESHYWYKTGDLAQRLSEQHFELTGRSDRQVKIRGYRIQLEEIESCLNNHPSIAQAIVTYTTNEQLLASVTLKEKTTTIESIMSYLSQQLPDYMLPNHIETTDSIALSASNKAAAPVPSYSQDIKESAIIIASCFANILNKPHVAIDEDIFFKNASSLDIMRLLIMLDTEHGLVLTPKQLHQCHCAVDLARNITPTTHKPAEAIDWNKMITWYTFKRNYSFISWLGTKFMCRLVYSRVLKDYRQGTKLETQYFPVLTYRAPISASQLNEASLKAFLVSLLARHPVLRLRIYYKKSVKQLKLRLGESDIDHYFTLKLDPNKRDPLYRSPFNKPLFYAYADIEHQYLYCLFHHEIADNHSFNIMDKEVAYWLEHKQPTANTPNYAATYQVFDEVSKYPNKTSGALWKLPNAAKQKAMSIRYQFHVPQLCENSFSLLMLHALLESIHQETQQTAGHLFLDRDLRFDPANPASLHNLIGCFSLIYYLYLEKSNSTNPKAICHSYRQRLAQGHYLQPGYWLPDDSILLNTIIYEGDMIATTPTLPTRVRSHVATPLKSTTIVAIYYKQYATVEMTYITKKKLSDDFIIKLGQRFIGLNS